MLSRQYDSPTPFAQMQDEWSSALQDLAKKQRDWLDQEFDVAFKSFNSAFGGGRDTNGSSLKEPAKSPATEQLKEVPAPAPLEQTTELTGRGRTFLGPSAEHRTKGGGRDGCRQWHWRSGRARPG